jgi:hypothetical protein
VVDAHGVTGRPIRVLAIVVGVVVVAGVVAAVLTARHDVPTYDRERPEGVVQAYLTAVIDGDHDAAAALLASGGACTVDDLDRAYVPDDVRVVLRDTRVDGDTAQVAVDIATSSGGPLDGSEFTEQQTFRLRHADGNWRITCRPWPMYDCAVR